MSICVACPLCGAGEFNVLFEGPSAPFDARVTTDIYGSFGRLVRCSRCGLVYRNPHEGEDKINEAYASVEDPGAIDDSECRSINAHLSMRTIRKFCSCGQLLEIGSFAGFLLDAARSSFDAVGVEPSRWAAQIARERYNVKVIEGDFSKAIKGLPLFDVVAAVDVLEHLVEPKRFLGELSTVLRPEGILYLVTPDIESLSARILGRWWWGLRPAHLTYFSPKTLNRLLSDCGFSVLYCQSYGRVFPYGYWFSRLRNYPPWIVRPFAFILSLLGWSRKVLYLDTRDSMEVVAKKIQ